ncbi:MAG: iron uptake transporter permease EfeU, partial [Microbacteriaceae bacterium]
MLATYLIGLREGLEAALVVSILIAYTRKLGRDDILPRLWAGILAAVLLSLGIGAFLTWSPYTLSERAEETVAGVLSLVAVGLVTWMIFWMAKHARHLRGELESNMDSALRGGAWGVVILGFVAVAREGIETALFIWAATSSGTNALLDTIGALLGIGTAIGLGWMIYRGILRINLAKFFLWTGIFLIVIAAGVLLYAVGELQEAGILPEAEALFSLSALIPASGILGTILSGVFNFTAEPTLLQAI